MNRKEFFRLAYAGEELSAADITAYKAATLHSSLANYATLKQTVSPMRRAVLTLGKFNGSTGATDSPTIAVTDDGSTGSASQQLLTFPEGAIIIFACLPNLTNVTTAAWAPTTPVMSIGTAAAGSNATLTTTEADIVPSTSLTISSGSSTFNVNPKATGASPALTDSTGATATNTISDVTSSFSQSVLNVNLATLALRINNSPKALVFDGTSTAKALFLNFACNSDPSTGKTIIPTGTIELLWAMLGDV